MNGCARILRSDLDTLSVMSSLTFISIPQVITGCMVVVECQTCQPHESIANFIMRNSVVNVVDVYAAQRQDDMTLTSSRRMSLLSLASALCCVLWELRVRVFRGRQHAAPAPLAAILMFPFQYLSLHDLLVAGR